MASRLAGRVIPTCGHEAEPHWGGGKCKRCYQRDWWRAHGYRGPRKRGTVKKPRPENQGRTFYPQAIVTVPNMPKGWGALT
jgi:hypothetical protein